MNLPQHGDSAVGPVPASSSADLWQAAGEGHPWWWSRIEMEETYTMW